MRWRKGVQDKQTPDGVSPCFNQMYQIANICWIIEKAKEFPKNICFIDYTKAFDCVDHKKNYGKFFKRREHQTILPAS